MGRFGSKEVKTRGQTLKGLWDLTSYRGGGGIVEGRVGGEQPREEMGLPMAVRGMVGSQLDLN